MEQSPTTAPAGAVPWREIATDAIRYWERRRIIYNLVLAAVVLAMMSGASGVADATFLRTETLLALVVWAVVANACYSVAYLVDAFAQVSGFRAVWREYRWVLFIGGLVFGAALAYFKAMMLFYRS